MCAFSAQDLYSMLALLPATYFLCYCFSLYRCSKKSMTGWIINFCGFLRYVFLPITFCKEPVYGFSKYSCTNRNTMDLALWLMAYELVFISAFLEMITHFERKKFTFSFAEKNTNPLVNVKNNRFWGICIFIVAATVLTILEPSALNQISFFAISSNTGGRLGAISQNASTLTQIARQIFVVGILSLFVVTVSKIKERSTLKNKQRSLLISLLLAGLCTSMVISEQRSSQIYCAFASIILLSRLYPAHKKKIVKFIFIIGVAVVGMLTLYKTFYAFKYSSYIEAIAHSDSTFWETMSENAEIYLLGPQTVASSLDFSKVCNVTIKQIVYDLMRPFIGLSFFVKNTGHMLTSERYNLFITRYAVSGYLLPLTGNAYCFLGFLLSPILICCIYTIAVKLEKAMMKSNSEYATFFLAYVYIRMASCMVCSNLATILVASSSVLISAGMVYLFQKILETVLRRAN